MYTVLSYKLNNMIMQSRLLVFSLFTPLCWCFSPLNLEISKRRTQPCCTPLQAATGIPVDGPVPVVPDAVEEDKPSVGVLLLNLGGPETSADVEGTALL